MAITKVGDGPKPLTQPDKTVTGFPDVAKTPTQGAAVPAAYPNVGDTFERAKSAGIGEMLRAQEKRIEKERDAAQVQFGTSVAAAGVAFGMGVAGATGSAAGAVSAAASASAPSAAALLGLAGGGATSVASALVASASAAASGGGLAAAAGQLAFQAVTEAAEAGGSQAVDQLASRWSQFVSESAASGGAVDPNALVQHVLREAYLQNTEDLRFFAHKVKELNDAKEAMRGMLEELRRYEAVGTVPVDAQAEADSGLQEFMAKFQQAETLASNVSKKLDDTASDLIKKWS